MENPIEKLNSTTKSHGEVKCADGGEVAAVEQRLEAEGCRVRGGRRGSRQWLQLQSQLWHGRISLKDMSKLDQLGMGNDENPVRSLRRAAIGLDVHEGMEA